MARGVSYCGGMAIDGNNAGMGPVSISSDKLEYKEVYVEKHA
jgi:hypothetical protein